MVSQRGLYVAAAIRIAFGAALLLAAGASKAPEFLCVVGVLALVAGVRRVSLLKPVLVGTGLAFAVGFPVLTVVWPAAWMWEPRQSEYEQMIGGIYLTLGVFVLLAARQPLRHLSLIWFAAWSSIVHGGIMAVQAAVDSAERANLIGDVPFLLLIGVVLAVLTPRSKDLPAAPQ